MGQEGEGMWLPVTTKAVILRSDKRRSSICSWHASAGRCLFESVLLVLLSFESYPRVGKRQWGMKCVERASLSTSVAMFHANARREGEKHAPRRNRTRASFVSPLYHPFSFLLCFIGRPTQPDNTHSRSHMHQGKHTSLEQRV